MSDFRYIVIDYDAGCINKTNDLNDDILSMIEQGYYRVIDLVTMETIDHNKNGLIRTYIRNYIFSYYSEFNDKELLRLEIQKRLRDFKLKELGL